MTPKEKAANLIEQFSPLVTTWDCYNDCPEEPEEILKYAKKCALITVDELIKEQTMWQNGMVDPALFWQEVKREINLL